MKNLFYFPIILIMFLINPLATNAQLDTITAVKRSHINNIIKLNAAGFLFGSISLQDEIYFNSKISVAFGANFSIPSLFWPKNILDNNTIEMENMELSGQSYTPEVRYYLTSNAPGGLYLAPYYRFSRYKMKNLVVDYGSDPSENKKSAASGTYTQNAFGLLFGMQKKISKRIVTDWWIIGFAFGKQEIEINAPGIYSEEDLDDFKKEAADINSSFDVEGSTSTNLNIIYELPVTVRMGFSIGYVF